LCLFHVACSPFVGDASATTAAGGWRHLAGASAGSRIYFSSIYLCLPVVGPRRPRTNKAATCERASSRVYTYSCCGLRADSRTLGNQYSSASFRILAKRFIPVAQPGGGAGGTPPRIWVHKKIPGCAVGLNTQNCAWFGTQISLITAMSFREAMRPPNHQPRALPLDPAGGPPFPRPPMPPPPNPGRATDSFPWSRFPSLIS